MPVDARAGWMRGSSVRRVLALRLAVGLWLECGMAAAAPAQRPDDVRVVERAELDAMRASGRWTVSAPRGEVTGIAPCPSGRADEPCIAAARQALRRAAAERGANCVLVLGASVLQSEPPRYAARGELYRVSPRR